MKEDYLQKTDLIKGKHHADEAAPEEGPSYFRRLREVGVWWLKIEVHKSRGFSSLLIRALTVDDLVPSNNIWSQFQRL